MKKTKKSQLNFRPLKSPYQVNSDDTWKQQIVRYLADPERSVCIGQRTYYKIMGLTEFRMEGRPYTMLAHVDQHIDAHINDVLIDENEHIFICHGIAMINYGSEQRPECLEVGDLLLDGDPAKIGEYLAVYHADASEDFSEQVEQSLTEASFDQGK